MDIEQKCIEFKHFVKSFDYNKENFKLLQKELIRFHFYKLLYENKCELEVEEFNRVFKDKDH